MSETPYTPTPFKATVEVYPLSQSECKNGIVDCRYCDTSAPIHYCVLYDRSCNGIRIDECLEAEQTAREQREYDERVRLATKELFNPEVKP